MIGCSMPNISVMAVFTRTSNMCSGCRLARLRSADNFEQARGAHATADAHGNDGVFGLAPAALDQGVTGQARPGHAVGMTNRDRADVDVELFRIDAELVEAIDHLHRKRLVQFPKIDIV